MERPKPDAQSVYGVGGRCALLIYVSHFDVVLIKLVLFLEDKLKSIRNRMTLETRFGYWLGDFNTLLRAGERARQTRSMTVPKSKRNDRRPDCIFYFFDVLYPMPPPSLPSLSAIALENNLKIAHNNRILSYDSRFRPQNYQHIRINCFIDNRKAQKQISVLTPPLAVVYPCPYSMLCSVANYVNLQTEPINFISRRDS